MTEKEIFDDFPLEYFCGCWPYHLENVVGHDKILLYYLTGIYLGKFSNTSIIHGEEGFVFAESLSSQCSRGWPCEHYTHLLGRSSCALTPYFCNPVKSR